MSPSAATCDGPAATTGRHRSRPRPDDRTGLGAETETSAGQETGFFILSHSAITGDAQRIDYCPSPPPLKGVTAIT